ncbi:hypothetical protein BD779DRAFT_1784769 [Infundibulicybe gibba]|nr:hypothetical protein BD779DRAFT_1784769 [Infundibulicybe gibba]
MTGTPEPWDKNGSTQRLVINAHKAEREGNVKLAMPQPSDYESQPRGPGWVLPRSAPVRLERIATKTIGEVLRNNPGAKLCILSDVIINATSAQKRGSIYSPQRANAPYGIWEGENYPDGTTLLQTPLGCAMADARWWNCFKGLDFKWSFPGVVETGDDGRDCIVGNISRCAHEKGGLITSKPSRPGQGHAKECMVDGNDAFAAGLKQTMHKWRPIPFTRQLAERERWWGQ